MVLATTDDISFYPGKNPYVYELKEELKKLKDLHHVPNIHECQIFPTIMVNKNESSDLFSTRIEYLGPNSPAIVIHNIGKNKSNNRLYRLKVGWIVIGFGFSFKPCLNLNILPIL